MLASPPSRPAAGRPVWPERAVAYGICTLLAITWTLFAGKDVPWDALHYHLYAGFGALNERLAIDLFPAGTQTYLNPYSHVPLYLMVRAGWPSLAIGVTFALLHSVMLWMTWELARAVSRSPDGNSPSLVTWSAIGVAFFNPVLLQELGSSFNDVTTGALGLAGYVALANAFMRGRVGLVAMAGALLGAASALKMSNALFVLLPALPLVLGCVTSSRMRLRALAVFVLCAAGTALVIALPWAWRLQEAFGNPVYPMLDGLFHPAAASTEPTSTGMTSSLTNTIGQFVQGMRDPRFLPSTWVEAVTRPFDMLRSRRLIHTETMAADVRYAALFVLALVGIAGGLLWRRPRAFNVETAPISLPSQRAFASLAISFGIAWIVWLSMSGNSRYFLPMACIASVLLVVGMSRILASAPPRALAYALASVFGAQVVLLWQATEYRWSPQRWDGPWVQATVPASLQVDPYLYLPMDSQSQSFLLPWLAPGSAFLGIASGIVPDSNEGRRARKLIEANQGRLRLLKLVDTIESDGRPVVPNEGRFDFALRRFGLRVSTGDCDFIRYKGNRDVIERPGPRSGPRDEVWLYTCKVVPGSGLLDAEQDAKRIADVVLDHVEEACPQLFRQTRGGSWRSGQIWRRSYADLALWVTDDGWVRFADLIRGGGDRIAIGRAEDWMKAKQKLRCWQERGRAYVELQQ